MRNLTAVRALRPGHILIVLGTLIALMVPLGVAFSVGAIPSPDGTIQGCYRTHENDNEVQGQLRVVSDPSLCKENETPLSWQQSGGDGGPDNDADVGGAVLFTSSIRLPLGPDSTIFSIGATTCTTEIRCQIAAPRSGTLANLFIFADTAPAPGAEMTVTLRVNGADTSLIVAHTEADGAGVKGNTTDTVAVNQGDLISVKFSETGGVTTPFYRASFELR